MLELRQLSVDDGMDVYEMLQEMPADENGLINRVNGMTFEQYKDWLYAKQEEAAQEGLVDGWKVPSTTYWLYVEGMPVGFGNLRHFLTDALRTAGGNIGYGIRPGFREKGYGKELLRLLVIESQKLGLEKVLMTIHKDNMASKGVALANGGIITEETDERILVWIDTKIKNRAKSFVHDCIKLVEPTVDYAEDIWNFRQEVLEVDADNEDQFAGCISLDKVESAGEWVEICMLRKSTETCNEVGTSVPSNMYLAVRESDNRIIGITDLRHHIDHPILGTWGGHCGYTVRPSERGHGYAKEMLRLNIENARIRGMEKLLITCDIKNEASEKTILANGGVFEKIIEVDGCRMKRYWITV